MNTFGSVYPGEGPLRIPFPGGMLNVAQDQHSNNQDARIVRLREVNCPFFGDLNSRNDQIALSVEDSRYADDDLADILALDISEAMEIWEARPISLFDCLAPSCRTPLPVRNRTHLLSLLRLERYFGLFVGAGDPVEFKKVVAMLCEGCSQDLQHSYDEQHRADLCIRQARIATLRKMPFAEYRLTPEWRARRNRVLLRAGYRCELCDSRGLIDVHHKTYDRYGDELLSDLIALCRPCHQKFHDIFPEMPETA